MKKKTRRSRIAASIAAGAVVMSLYPRFEGVSDTSQENYRCVLFASDCSQSVHISADNMTVNGDIVTNGTYSYEAESTQICGNIFECQQNVMLDFQDQIEEKYFYGDVQYFDYEVQTSDFGGTLTVPTLSEGTLEMSGDLSVQSSAVMSGDDLAIDGNSLNFSDSVIYSQVGDIKLTGGNLSVGGLIYAPFGNVEISGQNAEISGMIVAKSIIFSVESSLNLNTEPEFISQFGGKVMGRTETDREIGEVYFKDVTDENIIYDENGVPIAGDQVLLTADETLDFADISSIAEKIDAKIAGYIELTGDYQLELNDVKTNDELQQIIYELNEMPHIKRAEMNVVSGNFDEFRTNDSQWSSAWNEQFPGDSNWSVEMIRLQSALTNIGVIQANAADCTDADTSMLYPVKVGLIDGGFDENHPDLTYADTFNNYTKSSSATDHGTHVSGIMAATFNNGIGITGISIKNQLYGFSTGGNTDEVCASSGSTFKNKSALAWLIGNNVKVINHSLGNGNLAFYGAQDTNRFPKANSAKTAQKYEADQYTDFLSRLIDMGYDFLIVTSAGNSNDYKYYYDFTAKYGFVNADDYYKDNKKYPNADISKTYGTAVSGADIILNDTDARYDDSFQFISDHKVKSHIISVGSLSKSKKMSDFSCRGERVDILAPGEGIRSCTSEGRGIDGGSYCDKTGTSMAAPFVSGALGLAYSVCPDIKASALKSLLISSGFDFGITSTVVNNIGKTVKKNYKVLNLDKLTTEVVSIRNSLDVGSDAPETPSQRQFNGSARGFVVDKDGEPITGADVTVCLWSSDGLYNCQKSIPLGITASDGSFFLSLPAGRYTLKFSKKGYHGSDVCYRSYPEEFTYIGKITLSANKSSDKLYDFSGIVSDALSGEPIGDASVRFRDGWNVQNGVYSAIYGDSDSICTDSSGAYSARLKGGIYTAEIQKNGYITSFVNVTVSPYADTARSVMTPVLDENEYRAVLSWGSSPRDIDAHLVSLRSGKSVEVSYKNKTFNDNGTLVASLDRDDITSYGPETVTFDADAAESFCLYICDYENRENPDSTALSNSDARVELYRGNKLIKTFNVPSGHKGIRWDVFLMDESGNIVPLNCIS